MNVTKKIERIVLAAPFEKQSLKHLLPNVQEENLPDGYSGAPYLVSLVENLLERGIEVICVTTSKCDNNDYTTQKFRFENFSWHVVPSRKRPFRFNGIRVGRIMDLFYHERENIKACINEVKPDIVHAFWAYEFAWAALDSKYPTLITVEDNPYQILKHITNTYRFLRLIMSEIVLYKTKYASTLSPYMSPFVSRRCKNVKIIPNPTKFLYDHTEINILIQNRIESISKPKIIMINNGWDKRKNVNKAIDAFALFSKMNEGATLHLYGSGYGLNGPAHQYAAKVGLNNVFFYGKVSQKEIFDGINDAHLFLHSSLEESLGVVLLEAMSRGIPCIGGRSSGAVPWVIGNSDLLTDVSNPRSIAEKLQEILSDSSLYKEISMSSFLSSKSTFEANHITEKFYNYYLSIV